MSVFGLMHISDLDLMQRLILRDGLQTTAKQHRRRDGTCRHYDLPGRSCKIACPWCDAEERRR